MFPKYYKAVLRFVTDQQTPGVLYRIGITICAVNFIPFHNETSIAGDKLNNTWYICVITKFFNDNSGYIVISTLNSELFFFLPFVACLQFLPRL